MITYYGSKISDNITKTPEGYLICHNVPIARTGQQIYLGKETPYNDLPPDKEITVIRLPEEVFSRETLASFEGKPITDNHPSEDVTAENSRYYLKGIARDVRRGAGQFNDCIVADLMVYDPVLIDEILNKSKREISCGYDCFWEQGNGDTMIQRKIRGNHIAVVENGRAGHKVAVRDNKPDKRRSQNRHKGPDDGIHLPSLGVPVDVDADENRNQQQNQQNGKQNDKSADGTHMRTSFWA